MDRGKHTGRREVRARTLELKCGQKRGIYYVDVAGPNCEEWYTATIVQEGTWVDGLTFRAVRNAG